MRIGFYANTFVTPSVIEAATAARLNHARRINRKATRHSVVLEEHPHKPKHMLLSVPTKGYFTVTILNKGGTPDRDTLALQPCTREGKSIGDAVKVARSRYVDACHNRYVTPVVVSRQDGVTVYHMPVESWPALREALKTPERQASQTIRRAAPPKPTPVEPALPRMRQVVRSFQELGKLFPRS